MPALMVAGHRRMAVEVHLGYPVPPVGVNSAPVRKTLPQAFLRGGNCKLYPWPAPLAARMVLPDLFLHKGCLAFIEVDFLSAPVWQDRERRRLSMVEVA